MYGNREIIIDDPIVGERDAAFQSPYQVFGLEEPTARKPIGLGVDPAEVMKAFVAAAEYYERSRDEFGKINHLFNPAIILRNILGK